MHAFQSGIYASSTSHEQLSIGFFGQRVFSDVLPRTSRWARWATGSANLTTTGAVFFQMTGVLDPTRTRKVNQPYTL